MNTEPNADLVDALEAALRLAKAGQLRCGAMFFGYHDRRAAFRLAGELDDDIVPKLGMLMNGIVGDWTQKYCSSAEAQDELPASMSATSSPRVDRGNGALRISYGAPPQDGMHVGALGSDGVGDRVALSPETTVERLRNAPHSPSDARLEPIPCRQGSVTSDRDQVLHSRVKVRPDDEGELDEVFVDWPRHVHVEVMSWQHIWMGVTLDDNRQAHCNFYLELPDELRETDAHDEPDCAPPAVRMRYRCEVDPPAEKGPARPGILSRVRMVLEGARARLEEGDPLRDHAEYLLGELPP